MNRTINSSVIIINNTLYELIVIACIFANIIYTHQEISHISKWYYVIYPTSHICFFLFEGFSVYLLSFVYPKRKRGLLLLLYIIVTLILWINVGYSRYFDTYMPISLYTEFNNLDGLLPNIKDAIEKKDILFVLTSIIVVVAYFITSKCPKSKYSILLPLIIIGTTLGTFYYHYKVIKSEHEHLKEHFKDINDQRTIWDLMVNRRKTMEHTMPKECVRYYGIVLSLLLNTVEKIFDTPQFVFSEEEKTEIEKYKYSSDYPLPKDTTQNLIVIIVESLASYPINKSINGFEITPYINSLLHDAYYNPNMVSEAILGESSDGQFIYLTGLLPLRKGVTINEICVPQITTFVSMAKRYIPSLYSQMTIPTDKNAWSQEAMCKKYGIDKLFSKEQYPKDFEDDWLNDQQLFEYASETDKYLKPPFMSFILTSSMHSPYIKSYEDYHINYPQDFSPELKHYLDNTHYMDKYLGVYLNSLKKYSWYNQCTIIITADHKPNGPKLNAMDKSLFTALPLIIINSPFNNKIGTSNQINQTSIFPSILDMYHLSYKWKGVGQSIFMPDSIQGCTYEKNKIKRRQNISDYIINDWCSVNSVKGNIK